MKYLCSALVALTLTLQCAVAFSEETKAPASSTRIAGRETWQELLTKAKKEYETGHKDQSVQLLDEAAELADYHHHGAEEYLDAVRVLSDAYVDSNASEKAEKLLRETLVRYRSAPSIESEAFANVLLSLAHALDRDRQYYQQLGLYTRAGQILKRLYKPDSEKMAHVYTGLGFAQEKVKDFRNAKANLRHAIAIYEKLPKKDVRFCLPFAYIDLASAEADQHKIRAAYDHCKKAIYLSEAMTFPMSSEVCTTMYLAEDLLSSAGAVEEAKHLEWREDKIVDSYEAGSPDGVDPDNTDSGKWSKECMDKDGKDRFMRGQRAKHINQPQ
jgi:tetratricopeptide (TPR) repeat protein